MNYQPGRFSRLRWLQGFSCAAAFVGGLVLLGLATTDYANRSGLWLAAAGAFVVFLSVVLLSLATLLLKMESTLARQLGEMRDLAEAVVRNGEHLQHIAENTRISDAAKSLAHREQEVDALRNAIHENMHHQRWEPALNLVDEMERRFGFKLEADRIREELDDARREAIQAKLAEAIDVIESHFRIFEWTRANNEIERLRHALPNEARVLALHDRMKLLQEQHKQALKNDWAEAVRRSDTDHAIDVLKELDQYLSPAEAQSLHASARHVFKDKLLQLGVQFRFAVNEKRWQDALKTGLELVRDFPNARMANEVRDVLDTLRDRARHTDPHVEPSKR